VSHSSSARSVRLREVVGAVARQALHDRSCSRIAVLDDGSPEADLAARWLAVELGEPHVLRVAVADAEVESVLHALGVEEGQMRQASGRTAGRVRQPNIEVCRLRARLDTGALLANASNKTALLLGGPLPPEPFFPLGDLYATEVGELAGGWSAPPMVEELAERCGGVERLDAALREYFDRRNPEGLQMLREDAARMFSSALGQGQASRVFGILVPKLGSRTLGVDLFE
jgi:hypothetical protein